MERVLLSKFTHVPSRNPLSVSIVINFTSFYARNHPQAALGKMATIIYCFDAHFAFESVKSRASGNNNFFITMDIFFYILDRCSFDSK